MPVQSKYIEKNFDGALFNLIYFLYKYPLCVFIPFIEGLIPVCSSLSMEWHRV